MPVSAAYRPDPAFMHLGDEFADVVAPAAFPASTIRYRNARAARTVGLDTLDDAEWLSHFARFEALPDNQPKPLAMRYHGHQFRTYNPELGDGRGFLFAQLRETGSGRLLDLATKGSGRTPWSRTADGRLTLKGGVREVLAATMLETLGVPTSRAFSLIETGESLTRNDEPSPTRSAVLTRLSHSHIRFGSFQRHAYFERPDLLRTLTQHALDVYFPGHAATADPGVALMVCAARATARLTARWMAAGFVHGVLNTDNMVVTGESFDYGPWRFLPRSDPGFTAAYFDYSGLYAFGRQPATAFWNLEQLGGCLAMISPPESLIPALELFGPAYQSELARAMVERLGLLPIDDAHDHALAQAAFAALAEGGDATRWEPVFFDWFGGLASERRALEGPRGALYAGPAFLELRRKLEPYVPDRPERLDSPVFAAVEPQEMLIEEVEALWASIAYADDWGPLSTKLAALESARIAYGLDGSAA
jgi:serine/tyrosine/threonine adenylyltransferase